MPVGSQATVASINQSITSLSVQLRELTHQMQNLSTSVNGQGNGLAYLESIGFGSAANPANPGGVSDAQLALNMISYLNTVQGVVNGTASQATDFNFNQELSQCWGGQ